MLCPYVSDTDIRRAGDADAAAVRPPQVRPGRFCNARGLAAACLERQRRTLDPPLEGIRAPLHSPPRELEQPLDHAGTSPPIRAASIRTCGAPSVTGRGYCPPLPQPPPI